MPHVSPVSAPFVKAKTFLRSSAHRTARLDGEVPAPPPRPRVIVSRAVNPWQRRTVLVGALALAVVAAYVPTLGAGWVFDDVNLVAPSPALQDLGGLRRAITTDLYRQAAPRLEESPYWRPLALASFWLDAQLGEPPRSLHLGNVLLHALAAALLALVLTRRHGGTGGGLLAGALAAAWWALHPQNAEPVAWISCRYDLLCGVALLGLLAAPPSPGWRRAALQGLLFLAGLLSKDGFGAMVLVVVAADWAERRSLADAAPRWLMVLAATALWWGARAILGIRSMELPGGGELVGIARCYLDAVRTYALRAVVPAALTIDHPYGGAAPLALFQGGVILAALAAAAAWRRRLVLPVAVFAAGLLPAAAAMSRFGEVPERYFYLPSIGIALLVGELLARSLAARPWALRLLAPAAVAAATLLGLVHVEARLPEWRTDQTLFAAALRVDPTDPRANMQAGFDAGKRGDWAEARRALELAQRGDPRSGRIASALADVLLRSGDDAAALGQAERATAFAPHEPQGWFFRAMACHRIGDHAGELAAIDELLKLSPDYPGARRGRALAACEVSGRDDCRP